MEGHAKNRWQKSSVIVGVGASAAILLMVLAAIFDPMILPFSAGQFHVVTNVNMSWIEILMFLAGVAVASFGYAVLDEIGERRRTTE